jgi:MFS family permease
LPQSELHPPDNNPVKPVDRGLKSTFFSLTIRDYRIYWSGSLASFFAGMMQIPTQAWLAYQVTNSALLLGLTYAAQGLSQMAVAPFGGLLIDKMSKRNLIMITQVVNVLINLAIALLITTGQISFWHILLSSFLLGGVNGINMATRNAFVAELVPVDKLYNAIALNNTALNIARIAGPALAGVLIGFIGTQGAYYVGIGFNIVAIITISFLPAARDTLAAKSQSALKQLKDGFQYIKIHNLILILLIMEIGLTIFGMWFQGMMPVLANLLNADSTKYGFMMSAIGVGSLFGALAIAYFGNLKHKYLLLISTGVGFGLFLVLLGNSTGISSFLNIPSGVYYLALVFLVMLGVISTAYTATSMTVIQMYVSNEYRGRVTSMYQMALAVYPFSILISSALANSVGIALTLTIGGIALMAFMLIIILLYKRILKIV